MHGRVEAEALRSSQGHSYISVVTLVVCQTSLTGSHDSHRSPKQPVLKGNMCVTACPSHKLQTGCMCTVGRDAKLPLLGCMCILCSACLQARCASTPASRGRLA